MYNETTGLVKTTVLKEYVLVKFSCKCGNIIYDQSDFQSFKAYIVPEQDEEDLLRECSRGEENALDAFYNYSQAIYQCDKCARLILDVGDSFISFKPESKSYPTNLLRSVEGEKWKRQLRGRWTGKKGEVWWGFGVEDEGFIDTFSSKDEVEEMYFKVFKRLKSQNILRDSFLSIENTIVHTWPEE